MSSKQIQIEYGARINCLIKNGKLIVSTTHEFNSITGILKIDEAAELRNFLNEFIEAGNE